MNILVVSSYLPYPLYSGGHIRLYNLLKMLAKRHSITLVCEKRSHQTESDVAAVKKFCQEIITVEKKNQWSAENIIRTAVSGYPFLMVGHTSSEMKDVLRNILQKKSFDLIHVETFYVMQNLPRVQIPVVLVEHNIEYLVYRRYANQAPLFIRPFLLLDIKKIRNWEEYYWKISDALVAVSEKEKAYMKRNDVFVVPNGVDLSNFSLKKDDNVRSEKKVLFIGDFRWIQNRDTALWVLREVWPLCIKNWQGKEKIILWVVGKKIPAKFKKFGPRDSVVFDENAPENTADIFRKADVLLAPIRVGGGTSYKILEAMASGVPVVTTPLGIEGIRAEKDTHVVTGETSQELSNATLTMLGDINRHEKVARSARELIENEYTWEHIVKRLEKVYQSVTTHGSINNSR